MFGLKRFLLLGSIGVVVLSGLMFTSHTALPGTAHASGCNSVANGRQGPPNYLPTWSDNCEVSEGNISNFVSAVQEIVDAYGGCGTLQVDGNFGPDTFTAVKCFQKEWGFPPDEQDGIVGPKTWTALGDVLLSWNSAGGWDNYSAWHTSVFDFRMWDASGIWYVNAGLLSGTIQWCQMNLNAPCQS